MLPDGVASRPWRGRARPEANDGILARARHLLDAGQAPADLPPAVVVRRPRSSGPRRLDRSLPGLFDAPGGLLARREHQIVLVETDRVVALSSSADREAPDRDDSIGLYQDYLMLPAGYLRGGSIK